MELDKAIEERRSVRKFLSVNVEREKVAKIIQAGTLAPCAGNIQNWRFIIIEKEEIKAKLGEAALGQHWIATAPVIIVVCSAMDKITKYYALRAEKLYSIQNCAACAQNMILEATSLGLGTTWVSAFDEDMVSRVLNIPGDVRPQMILPLGYPNEKPPMPMKLGLREMCFIETYGNKVTDWDLFFKDWHYLERAIDAGKKLVSKLKKK